VNFTTNYCNVLKMKEALYILEFGSSQERSTMYSRILEALRKEALCILASGMGQGGGGEGEFPNSRRRRPKKSSMIVGSPGAPTRSVRMIWTCLGN